MVIEVVEPTMTILVETLTFSVLIVSAALALAVKTLSKGSKRGLWTNLPMAAILLALSKGIALFTLLGITSIPEIVSTMTERVTTLVAGWMLIQFFKQSIELF